MITYTKEQLKNILDQHKLWLQNSSKGKIANLSNANLSNANLSDANLYYADLRNADLSYAYLYNADLRNANLSYANLSYAYLYNADLRNANLKNADLSNADLYNADLRNANLYYASLYNANLSNAKFNPSLILSQVWWGKVSDKLCKELMLYDMINLPMGKKLFNQWKKDSSCCPFAESNLQRAINFEENPDLWSRSLSNSKRQLSATSLLLKLFKEKKIKY